MSISKRETLPAANAGRSYNRADDWRDSANCLGLDLEDFFPEGKGAHVPVEATRVCAHCPVVQQCLDFALEHRIPDGLWGGTTPRQRKQLTLGDTAPMLARICGECGGPNRTPRSAYCTKCRNKRAAQREARRVRASRKAVA